MCQVSPQKVAGCLFNAHYLCVVTIVSHCAFGCEFEMLACLRKALLLFKLQHTQCNSWSKHSLGQLCSLSNVDLQS